MVLLAGGCSAGDEPEREADASYRAPAGLLLARPATEGEEEENSRVEVLLDLVRNTPTGGRIRIVGNSFSFVPVAEALAAAHDRGGGSPSCSRPRTFVLTGSDNYPTRSLDTVPRCCCGSTASAARPSAATSGGSTPWSHAASARTAERRARRAG